MQQGLVITDRTEIKALTSLRGVAALLVVIFHFRTQFGAAMNLDARTAFFANGYLWVDFFFVLSGFVIALVYGDQFREVIRPADYGRFLIKRLGRVYPLHFFTLMCFIPTEVAKYFVRTSASPPFSENSLAALVANLFLIQAWGMFPDATWNKPSWSISVEWIAYLVFPAIALLFWRVRNAYLMFFLVICLLVVLDLSGAILVTTGIAIFRCLFSFAIGTLLYRFYAIGPTHLRGILGADVSLLASLLVAILAMHFDAKPVLIVAAFVWIVAAASLNEGIVGRVMASAPLYFLGTISYSIYLMQYLILRFWQVLFEVVWHSHIASGAAYAVLAILVLATIGVSTLSYRFIEKPGRRFVAKFSYKERTLSGRAAV